MKKSKTIVTNQTPKVYEAFREGIKTVYQVRVETGVERKNIDRLISHWQDRHQVYFVEYGQCPISTARAKFYTTNENRAWYRHRDNCRKYWENLKDDDITELWGLIRSFVLCQYDITQVPMASNDVVRTVWEQVRAEIVRRITR